MPRAEPYDWNAVVIGYWNRAILTPSGISSRLFGLGPTVPIVVEVPLDSMAPYRVRHESVTVTVESSKLSVNADLATYECLSKAMSIAAKGMTSLPETPFVAAGHNLHFRISEPSTDFQIASKLPMDDRLSDAGFSIETRSIKRSLPQKNGMLNLEIRDTANRGLEIDFNFHRQSSNRTELLEWLNTPIVEWKTVVEKIMEKVIGVQCGENQ